MPWPRLAVEKKGDFVKVQLSASQPVFFRSFSTQKIPTTHGLPAGLFRIIMLP
jgi:hypothetical protein